MNLSEMNLKDWITVYSAFLSTIIAVVAVVKFIAQKIKSRKERDKFKTDLYFLKKIDKSTQKVYPIVVILLANLGTETIALKSLEYEGIAENGIEINGSLGWYEQPEELFGIRNRLLPIVLRSGQTADLPMIEIALLTRVKDLKIWLTGFDDYQYYIDQNDIQHVLADVNKFINERKQKE
jgi:hypothetical protein